ncbi:carbohydrate-binding protein [Mucilaginibacter antarcticus]|uniref:carbohydrate-binding protein n=1 Tax=Mucilaginibacter antarcticus TaxID=1855725 RepID=UPI0036438B5A
MAAYATTLENTPGGTIEVRLDSPTGALLGQAEYEQLDLKPKTQNWVKAELKETTGLHDLYFVFKNEKAKASDALLLFNAIKFEQ